MSDIKNWSNSAGGNTAASPNGFPEGMAPSGVNDSMRETMASVKRWYEDAEWINFNHTPTFVGTGSFLVSAGQSATATYHPGRRIKVLDGSSTIYGTIHSSTWTASAVYIYSTNDGAANFTASISGVSVGIASFSNPSVGYSVNAGSANSASSASKAQYALQAYDPVSGNPVNFGVTSSANTVPIAQANGKLSSDWIPVGSTSQWAIVSFSYSLSISGTGTGYYNTVKVPLVGAGRYAVSISQETYGRILLINSTLSLVTSASGNTILTLYTGIYGSSTYNIETRPIFEYSASKTETIIVKLTTSDSIGRGVQNAKMIVYWRT